MALWWAFTWGTNIFKFWAHSESSIHMPPPQILSPVLFHFPIINHSAIHECKARLQSSILLGKVGRQQVVFINVLLTVKISLSRLYFSTTSHWDCNITAVHFHVVPTHPVELFIKLHYRVLLHSHQVIRNSQWTPMCGLQNTWQHKEE